MLHIAYCLDSLGKDSSKRLWNIDIIKNMHDWINILKYLKNINSILTHKKCVYWCGKIDKRSRKDSGYWNHKNYVENYCLICNYDKKIKIYNEKLFFIRKQNDNYFEVQNYVKSKFLKKESDGSYKINKSNCDYFWINEDLHIESIKRRIIIKCSRYRIIMKL